MDYPGLTPESAAGEWVYHELDAAPADRSAQQQLASEPPSMRQREIGQNTALFTAELDTFLEDRQEAT